MHFSTGNTVPSTAALHEPKLVQIKSDEQRCYGPAATADEPFTAVREQLITIFQARRCKGVNQPPQSPLVEKPPYLSNMVKIVEARS